MRTKFFSTAILLSLLLVLFSSISYAEEPTAEKKAPINTHQEDSKAKQQQFETLAKKVEKDGEIRVIVGLALPNGFLHESLIPDANKIRNQRAEIKQTQNLISKQISANGSVYVNYESIPYMAMKVNAKALQGLSNSPLVNFIQEDALSPPSLASSTGVIGMPTVWSSGEDGSGQTVVILDTGIDYNHGFFGSRVVDEACFSNAGGGGVGTSLCGSSSHPADAEVSACNGGSLCDHGTHVAGIAAGNGSSYDGVARGANIIAIQIFTRFTGSNCGSGPSPCVLTYNSDQLSALQYVDNTLASQYNVASVNMSLGGGGPYTSNCDSAESARKSAIDSLLNKGIATIIASGNSYYTNGVGAPACISTAVTVGSTTDSDAVSSFSNMGSLVDLLAPGSSIQSSVPGGGYASKNGTSMATPHVAGAFAVLKAANPSASVADILDALVQTGTSVTDNRSGGSYTKPRINVDDALDALTSSTCPSDYTQYTGYLSGTGDYDFHPNGTYYYKGYSGYHYGILDGAGPDFDLYLQKWNGSGWDDVDSSLSGSSYESITYYGTSGYYTWKIYSYSGSGNYDFCLKTP